METVVPKRRGRPPGVRNKPSLQREPMVSPARPLVPPSTEAGADYRHPDPDAIVSRQLTMLDWAQQATRNEMQRAMQSTGIRMDVRDIEKLEKLSNAIVRAIDALRKSHELADVLSKCKTPGELLELALKKVEGQDLATLNYAIKRLRAHRERIAPVRQTDRLQLGETLTGSGAIGTLGDDEV